MKELWCKNELGPNALLPHGFSMEEERRGVSKCWTNGELGGSFRK